ncbi:MAG: hypothetical protein HQK77_19425 [Desulfobacterales bacterium]|nr:hypothetical protein [Desulfobacterales bacterium]
MVNIVCIDNTAFLSILISSIESYPSKFEGKKKPAGVSPEGETIGLLFGQRIEEEDHTTYNVTLATPIQILKNKNSEGVDPSEKHINKIIDTVCSFPMYQFLGQYHSHPYPKKDFKENSATDPSEDDVDGIVQVATRFDKNIIEVIMGLTFFGKEYNYTPTYLDNHLIRNYCKGYKYVLGAYISNIEIQKVESVDNLICPICVGIGNMDLATID